MNSTGDSRSVRVGARALAVRRPGEPARLVNRREFLLQGAAGVLGIALVPVACGDVVGPSDSPGVLGPGGPPRRVAVVGAGLAGLVAAYELARAGHDVAVLEARAEPGGRVRTLRSAFADGHYAEAGAARIPETHDLTLGYARHLDLALDRFYPDRGSYLVVRDGNRRATTQNPLPAARFKIRGGADLLPRAFADRLGRLGARLEYDAPVIRIENGHGEANVVFDAGGSPASVVADHVICTVPFPVLARIEFAPPLSAGKQAAVRSLRYEPATRVYVQFGRRFWEDDGLNGFASTDWPEEVWHPSWDRDGPRGVLVSYLRGERAVEVGALDEPARIERVLEHWEDVLPGVRLHAEGGESIAWHRDEWTGGGYAAPAPGQLAEFGAHIASVEGRVHFAGEHASAWRGWMQGALASGLRAATEVHRPAAAAAWAGA